MNPEELKWAEQMQTQLELSEKRNSQMQKEGYSMSSYISDSANENLIKWQLDLEAEKEKVYHILQGHKLRYNQEKGVSEWQEPHDPLYKPLSEYGVDRIMNIIEFYLSRNTLLSNYEFDLINSKMEDIGYEIADSIFLEYEYIFNRPKIKDLMSLDKDKIAKIKDQTLPGLSKDQEKKLYEEIVLFYEERSNHIFKKNCRMYPLICRMMIDLIHSAYLRALEGGERESLRTARHVSQSDNGNQTPFYPGSKQGGTKWYNPLSWGG